MIKRLSSIFLFTAALVISFSISLQQNLPDISFLSNIKNHFNEPLAHAQTFPVSTDERQKHDALCKDSLAGTMTKSTCLAGCPSHMVCAVTNKLNAEEHDELSEDMECFGCRRQICEDVGRLGAAAKTRCDAQPDYESKPAAPLPDGTPCWSCEKIVDECQDQWPGSTVKSTCERQCTDNTKICAKLGAYKGKDCFACIPKNNPKPPKTCGDLGAITHAQCGACSDPTPLCQPAGFRDETGRVCFQCQPKPKACQDIGKTNRSICNNCRTDGGKCLKDGTAPNGEQCYTCEDRKCFDIGKKDRSICQACRADRDRCVLDGRSPSGERCYQCKDLKNCQDEGRTNRDVCATCGEDQVCGYSTTAEDGERCYQCKKKPKKTGCQAEGKLSDWDCESCEDDPDSKCVKAGAAENG
ncbi:MAG: hypothetical protein KC713_05255, partial [Candidatus Omnitrophica bacterium]|nr:hypothetical protein [Candidatus Omnitrophota bacterium]